MVNRKPVTVYLALGEGVACNTIFSWTFLQTIKSLIMNENNDLVGRLLGEQFKLDMMVPRRAREAIKISEGLPVSLPFQVQQKQENRKDRSSRNSRVELKKKVIHQSQTPGQN